MAMTYDDDTRARALELYAAEGSGAASAATGVPSATIRSWAARAGVRSSSDSRRARTEAATLSLAERRANLAAALLEDADRLRRQLFEPAQLEHFDGGQYGNGWQTLELDRPRFADQLAVVRALDVAVRNVQLLTGEATERTDSTGLDLEAELATFQAGVQAARDLARDTAGVLEEPAAT